MGIEHSPCCVRWLFFMNLEYTFYRILLYFDVLKAKVHKANPVRLVDEERLLDSNSNNYGATINQ